MEGLSHYTKMGGATNGGVQNMMIGAGLQVFEVSTLGQPFEVIKTHMAGINDNHYESINSDFEQPIEMIMFSSQSGNHFRGVGLQDFIKVSYLGL